MIGKILCLVFLYFVYRQRCAIFLRKKNIRQCFESYTRNLKESRKSGFLEMICSNSLKSKTWSSSRSHSANISPIIWSMYSRGRWECPHNAAMIFRISRGHIWPSSLKSYIWNAYSTFTDFGARSENTESMLMKSSYVMHPLFVDENTFAIRYRNGFSESSGSLRILCFGSLAFRSWVMTSGSKLQ